jgi:hypothetical protein
MLWDSGDPGEIASYVDRLPRMVDEMLWADVMALPARSRALGLAAIASALCDPERARVAFGALEMGFDSYDPLFPTALRRLIPLLGRAEAHRAVHLVSLLGDGGADLYEALMMRLAALGEPVDVLSAHLELDARTRILASTLSFAPDPDSVNRRILEAVRAADPLDRYGLLFRVGAPLAAAGHASTLIGLIEPLGAEHLYSALTFLAEHAPASAPAFTRRALDIGLRFGSAQRSRLLHLLPLLEYFSWAEVASLLVALLDALALEGRPGALSGDGVSVVGLVPLLVAAGGEAGVIGCAREIVQIARWFP